MRSPTVNTIPPREERSIRDFGGRDQRRIRFLVSAVLCLGGLLFAAKEAPEKTTPTDEKAKADSAIPAVATMKSAILRKNIFKPGRIPPVSGRENPTDPTVREIGPMSLDRPFTVLACDIINNEPQVHLQFGNPPAVRAYKVGDVIQFVVTILEIQPTFIRIKYDTKRVRIDKGETSDDALARLRGFDGRDYRFKGTTITDDIAFAFFKIDSREPLVRVEKGDWLGKDQIIDIQIGSVSVMLENGEEITIP